MVGANEVCQQRDRELLWLDTFKTYANLWEGKNHVIFAQ
jgi:hypothetical protein